MTLRQFCPPWKLRAHQILDMARAGMMVSQKQIDQALLDLGDLI